MMLVLFSLLHISKPDFDFDKLLGKWRMEGKEVFEVWEKTSDEWYANSHSVNNGVEVQHESIVIKFDGANWQYIPTVNGQNDNKPTVFIITQMSADGFTAENPTHDFPQKIQYHLEVNIMTATISGKKVGEEKQIQFRFNRQ
jgi:hypothetical protein